MSADASLQGTIEPCAEEDKQWHPRTPRVLFMYMFSRGGVKQRMRTNHVVTRHHSRPGRSASNTSTCDFLSGEPKLQLSHFPIAILSH